MARDKPHTFKPLENPLAHAAAVSRYQFAGDQLAGGTVLEAGCGARDGAVLLAKAAGKVVAVDVSAEAVHVASRSYPADTVWYGAMDGQALALRDTSVDAVVSLEVIEHVPDPTAYLGEIRRVLKPAGTYVASTPNRERPDFRPNPHHIREYTGTEYRELLSGYFDRVEMFSQYASEIVHGRGEGMRSAATRTDKLGLRRLIPQPVKDFVNLHFFKLKSAHLVEAEDWRIEPGLRDGAPVLVCVCRRGNQAEAGR